MPSVPAEMSTPNKQYVRSNSSDSRSEYASVARTMKDGQLYIETADDVNVDDSAIQKITEKYDSLGKLRSSMEKLDLNEDEPVQYKQINNEKEDFYYLQMKIGSQPDLTIENDGYYTHDELSEQDLLQVETFFRSHKTMVYVCPTITNLYVSAIEINTLSPNAKTGSPRSQSQWQLTHTGIPVLLLDSGETRSRTKRRIQIVLAEKGTGFLLWKDTIDNLTNYKAVDNHFHTMFLSVDHRKMIGLSFNNASAAREFYERIEVLTSDPANISLSGPNSKAAKKAASKKKKKVEKIKLPKKTDISQPCCFQHVTKVDLGDKEQFVTLATLTGSRSKTAEHANSEPAFRKEQLQKYKSEPTLVRNGI